MGTGSGITPERRFHARKPTMIEDFVSRWTFLGLARRSVFGPKEPLHEQGDPARGGQYATFPDQIELAGHNKAKLNASNRVTEGSSASDVTPDPSATATAASKALGSLRTLIPGLADAISAGSVIDLLTAGGRVPAEDDGIETSLAVWVDTDADQQALDELPPDRQYILMRNLLQQVKDPRSIIRTAFAKLAIDGWMIVTVPHQFLRERKYRMPSRYDTSTLRFHTPATLLMQIEEALDPSEYRIRLLKDDDLAFDYDAAIQIEPTGHKRIIMALQRIARPSWADQMAAGDDPLVPYDPRGPVIAADEAPTTTHVVITSPSDVENILVLKVDHRGDYQMAELVLRELRTLYSKARLVLVCGPWNAGTAQTSGLFDEVIPFEFFSENASLNREPPRKKVIAQFASLMQGRRFDLAIDLRSFPDSRVLLKHVEAKFKAGVDNWNAFPWLDVRLDLPSPTVEGRLEQGFIEADRFSNSEGHKTKYAIEYRHRIQIKPNACLIWGPYIDLPAGEYEFEFQLITLAKQQDINFDISADHGKRLLLAGGFKLGSEHPKFRVNLQNDMRAVEFRFYAIKRGLVDWQFSGVRYRRSGQTTGVHQQETMHLLLQLVAARMSFPYKDDIFTL